MDLAAEDAPQQRQQEQQQQQRQQQNQQQQQQQQQQQHQSRSNIVRVMAQNKELVLALLLAALALLGNVSRSATVVKEDTAYRSHQRARRFFPVASKVRDLYAGQMTVLQHSLFDGGRAFVMYYAPWSAESMRSRDEFHKAAEILHARIPFVAVNCWWQAGECSQKFKFSQFPSFFLYFYGVSNGFFYSGPATAEHLVLFAEKILFPIVPLHSVQAVDEFAASTDSAVISYFNYSTLDSRLFVQFYYASMRAIEKDFLQPVQFGIVLNTATALDFRLDLSGRPLMLRSLNDSLRYPEEANLTSSAIVDWAYSHRQQPAVTWYIPSLRKSRRLADVLSQGPTLLLFTEHDPLGSINHHFEQLRELALEYNDCELPLAVSLRLRQLVATSARLRSAARTTAARQSATDPDCEEGDASAAEPPERLSPAGPCTGENGGSHCCCFSLNSSLVWAAAAAATASSIAGSFSADASSAGTLRLLPAFYSVGGSNAVAELCVSPTVAATVPTRGSDGSASSFCRLPPFLQPGGGPWSGHCVCPCDTTANSCVLRCLATVGSSSSDVLADFSGISWTLRPCQLHVDHWTAAAMTPLHTATLAAATGDAPFSVTPAACATAADACCRLNSACRNSATNGVSAAATAASETQNRGARRRPTDLFVMQSRKEVKAYACHRKTLREAQGYATAAQHAEAEPPASESVAAVLRGAACRTNRTLNFLAFDSKLFPSYARMLLSPSEANAVMSKVSAAALLVDVAVESAHWSAVEGATSQAAIARFVERHLAGELPRSLRTTPAPVQKTSRWRRQQQLPQHPQPSAKQGDGRATVRGTVVVPDVSGSRFESVVLDDSKDVMVLYHTPSCGFCIVVAHKLLMLARLLRDVPGLVIVRLDANRNDLPWQFTVSQVPSLILFPAGRKSDSVRYDLTDGLDVVDLASFLMTHSARSISLRGDLSEAACGRRCLAIKQLHVARQLAEALRRMYRLGAAVSSLAAAVGNGTALETAAVAANTTWAFRPRLQQLEWHLTAKSAESRLYRVRLLNLRKLARALRRSEGARRDGRHRRLLAELVRALTIASAASATTAAGA